MIGGPYATFAGCDASRMLAKHNFDSAKGKDVDNKIDTLSDLNAQEKDTLNEWRVHFDNKYLHIGDLVESK